MKDQGIVYQLIKPNMALQRMQKAEPLSFSLNYMDLILSNGILTNSTL